MVLPFIILFLSVIIVSEAANSDMRNQTNVIRITTSALGLFFNRPCQESHFSGRKALSSLIYKTLNASCVYGKVSPNIPRKLFSNLRFVELFQLKNQDADIALSTFEIQYERSQYVDFAIPHLTTSFTFMIQVKKNEIDWQTIVSVLSLEVWLALLGCIVLLGLYLRCIIRDEDEKPLPIGRLYWFLIVTLTNQGVNINAINRLKSRITFGLWLLSISVLIWGYGNVLASLLTVRGNVSVPKTFEELASALERREYTCFANIHYDEIENLNVSTKLF
ncbi:glutamate receptor 2-like [Centruroides sculpturatus]|uniref:glutamate receptor 2-like n=1 Tax=Centruroides sculpturatus TaxID=218467 RepID=UPI000C6ECB4A|nr:glutamate receptor 2-like [Centruroides sculpturatus]